MDENRKAGRRYLIFFGVICILFVGILGAAWRISRRANPVMLDEHGQVSTNR